MAESKDSAPTDGAPRPNGSPAAATAENGILAEDSLLMRLLREPTTSPRLVRALNTVVVLLLLVLLGNIAFGVDDVHTYVMLALSIGLLVSLNWFIRELRRLQPEAGRGVAADKSKRA